MFFYEAKRLKNRTKGPHATVQTQNQNVNGSFKPITRNINVYL